VRVTDGGDPQGSAQTPFTVTVTDVNDAPTIAAIADISVAQGQVLNIQAVGSDIDPAAPNNTLTYSLVSAPAWVTINAGTGAISRSEERRAGEGGRERGADGALGHR